MVRSDQKNLVDDELAREVAWRLGSPIVISSSLFKVGGHYSLGVQLDRVADSPIPEQTWSQEFRASDHDDLYDAVDEAAYWVRHTLGEAVEQIERMNVPARDTTTASWEALSLFAMAEEAQYADRNDEARTFLKQAVKLDPDFALAWGRLGDISYQAEQANIFEYHRRALEAAGRRPLTKYEQLRIKAVYRSPMELFTAIIDDIDKLILKIAI